MKTKEAAGPGRMRSAGKTVRTSGRSRSVPHRKPKRRRSVNPTRLITVIFCITAILYLGCRFFLRTENTRLSVENQKAENTIETISGNIEVLENEISSLQEKSRVIGILDGQVSENQDNVYFYENN